MGENERNMGRRKRKRNNKIVGKWEKTREIWGGEKGKEIIKWWGRRKNKYEKRVKRRIG